MRANTALSITIVIILLAPCFSFSETHVSSPKSAEYSMSEYKAEKKKLTPLVFELFYAVKNSLDYGWVEGHGEPPQPKSNLEEYSRVTSELLEAFEKEYHILQYERIGDDYVLIVSSKTNPQEKYKATRMEKYVLSNGQWESLGGYLYF